MNARTILPVAICVTALAAMQCRIGFAATPGHLAYLHDDALCVAATSDSTPVTIPLSKGTAQFSLSPNRDGTIVFFAPRQEKAAADTPAPPLQAFYSRPPYRVSRSLPVFLAKEDDTLVTWAANGDAEISIGDLQTRRLDPKTGQLTLEHEDSTNAAKPHRHAGATSPVIAFTDADSRVIVESTATGQDRVLFSPTAPAPLFAALKRAHAPAKLKELTDEIDPTLWKDPHNWSVGVAAMTPDRKTVFFAVNFGTGMGAQGNTNFCFFAADVRTGSLSVLSKTGGFFGRVPVDCEVSPDGQRLFFATSVHNSAADNSFCAYILDLPTQQCRELLRVDTAHAKEANLMDGWCWSPDGHQLAISALYYDPAKIANDSDPDMGKATLYFRDAATGRILRQIPHAHLPQWYAN